MKVATKAVVLGTAVLGIVALQLLGSISVDPTGRSVIAALAFATFAFLGGSMPYRLASKNSSGSVSFIAILAGVAVSPTWATALAFTGAQLGLELLHRRPPLKVAFNVSQHLLATSAAAIAFILITRKVEPANEGLLVAILGTYLVFLGINSSSVAIVVAADTGESAWDIWCANTVRGIGFDVVALPLAWLLSEAYLRFGFLVASAAGASLFIVRQLNGANEDLARTNTELLELTVTTLEARDPFTSGHSRRVSRYAKMIGQQLGLNGRALERLSAAALLHDVGKIHEVFVAVLSKPGRLTPEERAIMETHPVKGAELVSISSHLKDLVEPIRHHHEAWDGSGYPDALAGDGIPLYSRVIAVADTIDAMASDRPYRKGLDAATIRSELFRMRGRQFDPLIIDVIQESGVLDSILRVACDEGAPAHIPAAAVGEGGESAVKPSLAIAG